jgi:uncharacterized membrane protein YkvA (DUF1232 family)
MELRIVILVYICLISRNYCDRPILDDTQSHPPNDGAEASISASDELAHQQSKTEVELLQAIAAMAAYIRVVLGVWLDVKPQNGENDNAQSNTTQSESSDVPASLLSAVAIHLVEAGLAAAQAWVIEALFAVNGQRATNLNNAVTLPEVVEPQGGAYFTNVPKTESDPEKSLTPNPELPQSEGSPINPIPDLDAKAAIEASAVEALGTEASSIQVSSGDEKKPPVVHGTRNDAPRSTQSNSQLNTLNDQSTTWAVHTVRIASALKALGMAWLAHRGRAYAQRPQTRARNSRMRWVLLGLGVVYLFSPLDLIPDVIPVFGMLDDLVLVPLLAAVAWSRVPWGWRMIARVGWWLARKPSKARRRAAVWTFVIFQLMISGLLWLVVWGLWRLGAWIVGLF